MRKRPINRAQKIFLRAVIGPEALRNSNGISRSETWLVTTQKLEAAVVARIEPSVQSCGLSCRRLIKRELALAGWLQPVRVNGQDRGDQPCPFAVEDVNDILAR